MRVGAGRKRDSAGEGEGERATEKDREGEADTQRTILGERPRTFVCGCVIAA